MKQRFVTGLVLAALFLSAMFWLNITTLAVVFALVAAAGSWEWAAMAGWNHPVGRVAYVLLQLSLLAILASYCQIDAPPERAVFQPLVGAACLFWSVAMLLVESYPGSAWIWRSMVVRTIMGWLVLTATWLSVVYLLGLKHGPLLMVLLVVLVAVADIGAFFTGKSFGKHKLAPEVSPGKTWEGLWGGLMGAMALTALVWWLLPTGYQHLQLLSLLLIGLACAGAAALGDLTVSMVKRGCGVKDSGSLLPGHGGLLDRLDSLCGAAPVFALSLMLVEY